MLAADDFRVQGFGFRLLVVRTPRRKGKYMEKKTENQVDTRVM